MKRVLFILTCAGNFHFHFFLSCLCGSKLTGSDVLAFKQTMQLLQVIQLGHENIRR